MRAVDIGLGIVGLVTGSIAATVGTFLLFVDGFHCLYGEPKDRGRCEEEQSRRETRDGIIIGAGVGVVITGAVLLALGAVQPKVTVTERERSIAQHVSALSWRAPEPSRVPTAGAPTFPLLTARF